jgi:hypothetical protein
MQSYEIVVVFAVKNSTREIVSPTSYETLDKANADLDKIAAARRSGEEWPDVPWLSIRSADVTAAFVRGADRPGGPPTDIEALIRRMGELLGFKQGDEKNDDSEPPRRDG